MKLEKLGDHQEVCTYSFIMGGVVVRFSAPPLLGLSMDTLMLGLSVAALLFGLSMAPPRVSR
jgi:hypothetical protein